MREMRCPVLDGPFLHGMRDGIRHVKIERLALFDGFGQLLVRIRRKTLLHHVLRKDHRAILLRKIGHARLLRLRPIAALKSREEGGRSNAHCENILFSIIDYCNR